MARYKTANSVALVNGDRTDVTIVSREVAHRTLCEIERSNGYVFAPSPDERKMIDAREAMADALEIDEDDNWDLDTAILSDFELEDDSCD